MKSFKGLVIALCGLVLMTACKKDVAVSSISVNPTTLNLKVGESSTITADVQPDDATNRNVVWSTSDAKVATVDATGKVTAVKDGSATITATTEDGAKSATCAVTVVAFYLPGEFSVSSGTKVRFSKGNLQATIDATGNPTAWKFAAHQYDIIGTGGANRTIGTAGGDIDFFGWSTNGVTPPSNAYKKWGINTSTSDNDYLGDFVDWGTAIDSKGTWRTLTGGSNGEVEWLLGPLTSPNPGTNCRTSSTVGGTANARYAKAKVNGVTGLLIFPDVFTWTAQMGTAPTNCNVGSTVWDDVPTYTIAQFSAMESAGCVFLPVAGYRDGSNVSCVGSDGKYWSSAAYDQYQAYFILISNDFASDAGDHRKYGYSVRLVTDVK